MKYFNSLLTVAIFLFFSNGLFGVNNSFSCSVIPNNSVENQSSLNDGDISASTRVKVYNRTDWTANIYINGYYQGYINGDHYDYFRLSPGYHKVTVKWSSGYYEYFDFYVGYGQTYKIWTSDYDG